MRRRSARRTGPGLVNTMARTAVIAGTATAVSGSVAASQASKAQQRQANTQKEAEFEQMKQQMNALQSQQVQQAVTPQPSVSGGADLIAQLQQLGELRANGVLTDAEFEAAKHKIINA